MRLQKYKKKSIHHNFNIKFNIIKASAKAKLAWIMPSTIMMYLKLVANYWENQTGSNSKSTR